VFCCPLLLNGWGEAAFSLPGKFPVVIYFAYLGVLVSGALPKIKMLTRVMLASAWEKTFPDCEGIYLLREIFRALSVTRAGVLTSCSKFEADSDSERRISAT
jgi:hypothetical protein